MRVARVVLLIGAILLVVSGAEAVETGRSGIGFFGSAHIPLSKFADWYSASPKFGATYSYVATSRIIAEIEYHYSKMGGGDLDDRTFTWSVDSKPYKSPSVSQEMDFHSLGASAQIHFRDLGERGAVPYLAGGAGFFRYSNRISGLIFPGQAGTSIDPNVQIEPFEDEVPSLTFMIGGGISIVGSDRYMVDLRLRYDVILGELRPLEDWGLKKTFPMQALDLSVGLKYFW